jgi:hypothetical protein
MNLSSANINNKIILPTSPLLSEADNSFIDKSPDSLLNKSDFNNSPDTCVLPIKLDGLTPPFEFQNTDAIKCQNCNAYLSSISKVVAEEEDQNLWNCKFCDFTNKIQIKNEEIPKDANVTYKLQSEQALNDNDSGYLILCVDISRNMEESTKVKGIPPTDVIHLRLIQDEILKSFSIYASTYPNKKVLFVTFNNEVRSYICDGITEDVTINGPYLVKKIGIIVKANLTGELKPIKETWAVMQDKISKLVFFILIVFRRLN